MEIGTGMEEGEEEEKVEVMRQTEMSIERGQIFGQFGRISSVHLVRDIVTGISKRYAFVTFSDLRDLNTAFLVAFKHCHHLLIDGYQIIVDYERARTMPGWVPRRLGGGLGGKKESGQLRFGGRERPFKRPILLPDQDATEFRDLLRLKIPPILSTPTNSFSTQQHHNH
ncbi:U11/U12 small nuclear ribonucleoprotein 35 kDa protein [Pelomyxa schiedti]|nr:U11/U12 small nuclear ribonucleoprotein 35 kDa protein [Pelomyxa schiedti]